MAATNVSKKQKLLTAAGAAVMAVYNSLTATPTVSFPRDDDDDIYSASTAWESLDVACGMHCAVEGAALAVAAVAVENVVKADIESDTEDYAMRPNSADWFDKDVLQVRNEENWMQQIKMNRKAFLSLVRYLEPALKREQKWKHVAVEIKLGATLYRLVSAASFEELGEKFAIDSKTAKGIMEETVKALNSKLKHIISWPTGEAMERIIRGFKEASSLPNCCGAIGGCDILITGTNPNYRNKNGTYSVILQAVCDTQNKFSDVICGWPGRTHKTRVLRNSKFFERVDRRGVLSGRRVPINSGFLLRQYVVGDGEYPYLPWLITPYCDAPTLTYSHKCFNKKHEKARRHINRAFHTLKSTFSLLGQPVDDDLTFLPQLIFSACILHNLLIDSRELDFESILDNRDASEDQKEEVGDILEEDVNTIRDELMELIALTT